MVEKVLQVSIFDNAIKLLARSVNEIEYLHRNPYQRTSKTMTKLKSRVKRVQNALWSYKNRETRIREERERSIAEIELLNKQEELLEVELSEKKKSIIKIESDLQYLHQEIKKRKHLLSIRAAFVSNLEETQNKKEAVRNILSDKNELLKKAINEEEERKQNLEMLQSKRLDRIISFRNHEIAQKGKKALGGHKCMKDTKNQHMVEKQSATEEAMVKNRDRFSSEKEDRTSMSPPSISSSSVQDSQDTRFNDQSAGMGQKYGLKNPPHMSFLEALENRENAAMKIQRGWRKDRYKELALLDPLVDSAESNIEKEMMNTTHSRRRSQKRIGSRKGKRSNSKQKRKKIYARDNVPVSNFSCFGHALEDLHAHVDLDDGCVNIIIPRTTNSKRRVRRVGVFGNL